MITAIDTFTEIVSKMPSSPRFYSDNWQGVANTMSSLGLNHDNDGTHYPLIVLDTNYSSEEGGNVGLDNMFNAKFYFINRTQSNYNTVDRENLSYKANLYPLMNEFLFYCLRSAKIVFDSEPFAKGHIDSLGNYNVFMQKTVEKLPYLKGKDSKQNKLNAIVDALAVEITIKLSV